MTSKQKIGEALKEDWYIQGFNAVPAFITPSAWSGFALIVQEGFGYTKFLFHFQNEYCEMHYWQKDLARLWQIVERKLARQPRYLEQMKRRHEQRFQEFRATFSVIDKTALGNISEADLFALWRRCVKAQIESVGASHVIEAISMALEDKIAKILRRAVSDQKEYRRCFSLLTVPSQLSFVSREEKDLFALRARPAVERTTALAEHARKYYWIRNSYVQAVAASDRYFSGRLATLKKPADNASARAQKARCLKTLDLSTEARRVIELIDLCTVWQDERKEKVLRTITYLDRVINEVSRRVGVTRKQLHYLSALEMVALTSPGLFSLGRSGVRIHRQRPRTRPFASAQGRRHGKNIAQRQ